MAACQSIASSGNAPPATEAGRLASAEKRSPVWDPSQRRPEVTPVRHLDHVLTCFPNLFGKHTCGCRAASLCRLRHPGRWRYRRKQRRLALLTPLAGQNQSDSTFIPSECLAGGLSDWGGYSSRGTGCGSPGLAAQSDLQWITAS